MLEVLSPSATPGAVKHKPSFIERSTSITSLVAWKQRFDSYSGKFLKQPTFVSYTIDDVLRNEKFNNSVSSGPCCGDSDLPPPYPSVVELTLSPEEEKEKIRSFKQNFAALEEYFKKKLFKKQSFEGNARLDRNSVYEWLHELPEGNNLEEFLEAYGIPTQGVDTGNLKEKLRAFIQEKLRVHNTDAKTSNENLSDDANPNAIPHWQRQLTDMQKLAYGDNLEKWIESLDVPFSKPIPEIKREIRKYLHIPEEEEITHPDGIETETATITHPHVPDKKDLDTFVPKWKEQVEKMGALKTQEELDKWLDSLDVPHHVQKERMHAEIKRFFRHETFETFAGKSIIFQERHIAKQLWDKFEDSSLLKQVGMIAGTTAVLGVIAVLSTTLLSFAFPSALAMNPFFTEVFAQYFLQRNDVAFNLLNFHASQAKPLSTAWAKQYILWKYC